MKKVVKIIPKGSVWDSREPSIRYWLSRPPAERVAAGRDLRALTHRKLTGRGFPAMVKSARRLRPA